MRRRTALLAALLAAAQPGASAAAPDPACVLDPLSRVTEAEIAYRTGIAELVAARAPALSGTAHTSAALQIAKARRTKMRARWLLASRPGRIDRPDLVRGHVWTAADQRAMLIGVPGYGDLLARIDRLTAENDRAEDWPDMLALFREEIAPGPAHAALVEAREAAVRRFREAVAPCFD